MTNVAPPPARKGIRFHVEPRDVPAHAAARRLGLTEGDFARMADRLYRRGFPRPDPDTGNYDLDAIDQWRKLRNRNLFGLSDGPVARDASVAMARIEARRRGLG
ncbi:hypothetical protein [Methylobacterium gnaphalii]|uniref:Uncharacterized protein n=1 Tax=Methylobacterium gnaphalii TaxID=1010610 RepID=A0A512JQS4_9HYPH|nr:hypothetical protein [Methylobacterium gnaphalii]GEP12292.1 hypothetical protein MGN01_41370 [Methylobacterium gnaphalii]GJD68704.1 hypothetical protein MMMDOFMJ_1628 [Methylobacterium gnaphalii]GLS49399.1 hypothetical protein GCM10007885_22470 [Methylobacterium gnaphalii]